VGVEVGVEVGCGVGVTLGCGVVMMGVMRRIVGVGVGRLGWGLTIRLKAMLKTISKLSTQKKIFCPLPLERLISFPPRM